MQEIAERFNAVQVDYKISPRYNIAPSQRIVAVRESGATCQFEWGLVPRWSKDPSKGPRPINARAETLTQKPSFKSAFKSRRCLIPADGFYEWRKRGGGKQPMFIRLRSEELFAFAGLWEEWVHAETGEVLETCTIVTTRPNELMAEIHDRMPAILRPEFEGRWLDPKASEQDLMPLLEPCPADSMEAIAVSKYVNSTSHDDPKCLDPDDEMLLF